MRCSCGVSRRPGECSPRTCRVITSLDRFLIWAPDGPDLIPQTLYAEKDGSVRGIRRPSFSTYQLFHSEKQDGCLAVGNGQGNRLFQSEIHDITSHLARGRKLLCVKTRRSYFLEVNGIPGQRTRSLFRIVPRGLSPTRLATITLNYHIGRRYVFYRSTLELHKLL